MTQSFGRRTKTKFIILSIALLGLLLVFNGVALSQTAEELKFYSERIEFGEIEVKRNTLSDLRNIETESASRVAIPALRDLSDVVRATAASSVVYLPEAEAVQVLLPLLDDRSVFVRREAAFALGQVGSELAAQRLVLVVTSDKEMEVKTAAAVSLGKIGSPSAVEVLTNILSKKPKDSSLFLRRAAARSIGQIAQRLQLQNPTSTTPESFLPDKYKQINDPKYRPLTKAFPVFIGANASLIQILQSLKETPDVKREAAFALGEIGDKGSIRILQPLLGSKDYYLSEISEEALRKVNTAINSSNSEDDRSPKKTQN